MRAGNDLGSGRIGVLVGRIALPSMLAQFISVLYSIVDRIFIGQIPGEGALALAGAGVCGPVVTMVGSVAFLVGVGGAPLLSIKRGEGDDDAARGILANCFLMLCVFSVALPAAILPFREPMLRHEWQSKTGFAGQYLRFQKIARPNYRLKIFIFEQIVGIIQSQQIVSIQ